MAHIYAASPNGPRGSGDLAKEELNSLENLILLCRNCHKIVDENPHRYPVKLLKDWKRLHEKKLANGLSPADKFSDPDLTSTITLPDSIPSWNYPKDAPDLPEMLKEFGSVVEQLQRVPIKTRRFLSHALIRSIPTRLPEARTVQINTLRASLTQGGSQITYAQICSHLEILVHFNFADRPNEGLFELRDELGILAKAFEISSQTSRNSELPDKDILDQMIVNLDFTPFSQSPDPTRAPH